MVPCLHFLGVAIGQVLEFMVNCSISWVKRNTYIDGEFVAVDHRLVDCFGMVAHVFEIYNQFSFFRESTQPVSIVLGSLRTCVVNETLKTAAGALTASQPQAKLARGPFVSVAVSAPEHGWKKWLLMGKEDERSSWHLIPIFLLIKFGPIQLVESMNFTISWESRPTRNWC